MQAVSHWAEDNNFPSVVSTQVPSACSFSLKPCDLDACSSTHLPPCFSWTQSPHSLLTKVATYYRLGSWYEHLQGKGR